jgi:hypothetical protein
MTPPARPDREIRLTADEGLLGRVPVLPPRRDGQRQASIAAGLVGGEGAGVISKWSVPRRRNAPSQAILEGATALVRGAIRPCSRAYRVPGPSSAREARAPRVAEYFRRLACP